MNVPFSRRSGLQREGAHCPFDPAASLTAVCALGLSAHQDQQLAGLIMKVIGDPIVWLSTAFIFFRWQADSEREARAAEDESN